MPEYIIIKNGGEGLYEEKKSRFIAAAYPVAGEEQAAGFIEAARKRYWDARHNCYAFVADEGNGISRCSDDGEPSGTAGKPILEVINGAGVHNCLVVVTRYFGGTLLGTGGLVRAYTAAARAALDGSTLVRVVPGVRYNIDTDYNGVGKIQYAAASAQAVISSSDYSDKVRLSVDVRADAADALCAAITENTGGRAVITKDCDMPIEIEI